MFFIFIGGMCLITGSYGMVEQGYSWIYLLAVVFGSMLIGYALGER